MRRASRGLYGSTTHFSAHPRTRARTRRRHRTHASPRLPASPPRRSGPSSISESGALRGRGRGRRAPWTPLLSRTRPAFKSASACSPCVGRFDSCAAPSKNSCKTPCLVVRCLLGRRTPRRSAKPAWVRDRDIRSAGDWSNCPMWPIGNVGSAIGAQFSWDGELRPTSQHRVAVSARWWRGSPLRGATRRTHRLTLVHRGRTRGRRPSPCIRLSDEAEVHPRGRGGAGARLVAF